MAPWCQWSRRVGVLCKSVHVIGMHSFILVPGCILVPSPPPSDFKFNTPEGHHWGLGLRGGVATNNEVPLTRASLDQGWPFMRGSMHSQENENPQQRKLVLYRMAEEYTAIIVSLTHTNFPTLLQSCMWDLNQKDIAI